MTLYRPPEYEREVTEDNLLHELELGVCSPAFTKFYSRLLKMDLPADLSGDVLELTQRMVFRVWIKNQAVREIMEGLQTAIHLHPEVAMPVIQNREIPILLLESSETDIRTSLALLLASCVASVVESKQLPLTGSSEIPEDK